MTRQRIQHINCGLPPSWRIVPGPTEAETAALDNNDDADDRDCQRCDGTGEGMQEGQSCGTCKGRGY